MKSIRAAVAFFLLLCSTWALAVVTVRADIPSTAGPTERLIVVQASVRTQINIYKQIQMFRSGELVWARYNDGGSEYFKIVEAIMSANIAAVPGTLRGPSGSGGGGSDGYGGYGVGGYEHRYLLGGVPVYFEYQFGGGGGRLTPIVHWYVY